MHRTGSQTMGQLGTKIALLEARLLCCRTVDSRSSSLSPGREKCWASCGWDLVHGGMEKHPAATESHSYSSVATTFRPNGRRVSVCQTIACRTSECQRTGEKSALSEARESASGDMADPCWREQGRTILSSVGSQIEEAADGKGWGCDTINRSKS